MSFLLGLALGVAGGLAPGPLQAMIVAETLRKGLRHGLAVAVVPPITDGPLVVAAALVALELPGYVLRVVGLVGSAVLAYMGIGILKGDGVEEIDREEGAAKTTLGKAVLVNLVNPHPYLFWLTVGPAVMAEARSFLGKVTFPIGFFAGIVGTQAGIAWAVHRAASMAPAEKIAAARRYCGLLLLGAAGYLAFDSLTRLP
ncbi:MAG: LysE family transporter [Methanopyri archaeon]|nr:LysE family transporter [Methanopyri archaeon]